MNIHRPQPEIMHALPVEGDYRPENVGGVPLTKLGYTIPPTLNASVVSRLHTSCTVEHSEESLVRMWASLPP